MERNIEHILKILPHRHPFVLVDRVLEFHDNVGTSRVGRKVKALKNVTFNEPFFPGHFPNRPIMPGVLVLEAMAQAGVLVAHREEGPDLDVAIARIGEVRFHRPVVPGDQLILEAEVIKDRGHMILLKLSSSVNGEPVAETELLASVVPRKV